ncbi:MAG: hypothetical protein IJX17_00745 [Clostridia bacterium]|nr:hypothetical protein [Clostridia bacterium]
MKLKDRIKTYNFWVSLASAVLLIINTLGKQFDFSIDEKLYNDLLTSFCGILVLLGIIVPPSNFKKGDLDNLNYEIKSITALENEIKNEIIKEKEQNENNEIKEENITLQNIQNNANNNQTDFANYKNNLQNLDNDFNNSENISKENLAKNKDNKNY